jgi:multiple sugar transport system substrate-binding protein
MCGAMPRHDLSTTRRAFLNSAARGAAAAALAAGCERRAAVPTGVVELDFYTYATPEFRRLFHRQLTPAFLRAHPGLRIRVNESMGDAGYDAKLLTLIAGRIAPDLFHVTQQNFPFYAAKDVLLPLDEFLENDPELSAADFYPQLLAGMRYNGKLLGLPSDFSPIVMLYNQSLFDHFDVPHPAPDWTGDDFLDAATRLTRDADGDGRRDLFGFAAIDSYNRWPAWVWNNGGRIFSVDGKRCVMDAAESIEGLRFYVDLARRHKVAPTPGPAPGLAMGQDQSDLFAGQRVAMIAESRYIYKRLIGSRNLAFRWDVAPMPKRRERATTFIWGGNCILKGTRHPRQAWEFLKFMSGPAGAAINLEAGNALPAYRAAAEREIERPSMPGVPAHDHYFLDAIAYGRTAPCPPQYAEFTEAMTLLRDAFLGLRTVEDACARFTAEVNDVLRSGVF